MTPSACAARRAPRAAASAIVSPLPVLALLGLLLLAAGSPAQAAPQALAMQPDLHGDLIAFVHAEDIWTVPAAGGVARRITFHEGEERAPKFSPDGARIAFTAEYDGNTDVYVMNTEGGNITRLTCHPGADEVVGWHPVSGKVLFRSGRDSYSRFQRLFLIAPDGSGLEALPLPEAGWGAFNADGSLIAYTRVATEDRTWKRYRGGLAPDLYLYDVRTGTDRQLTNARGTERFPMWIGGTLYYEADPDGVLNLYSMDPKSGESRQLTRFSGFRRAAAPRRGAGRSSSTGRRARDLRPGDRAGEGRPVPGPRRRARGAPLPEERQGLDHRDRPLARRRTAPSWWRAARSSPCRARRG